MTPTDSSKTAVFCNSCLRIYGEMQKRFLKFVTFCVFEKIKKTFLECFIGKNVSINVTQISI